MLYLPHCGTVKPTCVSASRLFPEIRTSLHYTAPQFSHQFFTAVVPNVSEALNETWATLGSFTSIPTSPVPCPTPSALSGPKWLTNSSVWID